MHYHAPVYSVINPKRTHLAPLLDNQSSRAHLKRAMSLTSPKSTSVCRVRSWASSTIMQE